MDRWRTGAGSVTSVNNPTTATEPSAQPGRRPRTSRAEISGVAIEMFTASGFEETSVDDIADAVGIARRTLFRYFPSKNAIPWGDFDSHLDELRAMLDEIPQDLPIAEALTRALTAFNHVPADTIGHHRRRMGLLLGVPSLQAHSMLMYADWRQVIAEFCAHRLGVPETDHLPQTIGWMSLGTALAAYEHWLADPDADLDELIRTGCTLLADGVRALH
ncbi:mycofactocin system transcriptional regulator [Gordonia desulfuricans]|uniref:Mycofactocin system transcriptional regulator n=1 Tax=Gordonia desulfuricans TaxID=89051 RepID=A0A7K3LR38_9ACTN|nr:mycofactocin system transcriptional regulator [Gordonia desulfuricans]